IFIEFTSSSELNNNLFENYGKNIFWKDYYNAFDLLNKIRPNKVVFFFIESYNHVALNVACKELGIPTYHLEHGIRNYEFVKIKSENKTLLKASLNNKEEIKNLITKSDRFKTFLFFFRTILSSNFRSAAFLIKYY